MARAAGRRGRKGQNKPCQPLLGLGAANREAGCHFRRQIGGAIDHEIAPVSAEARLFSKPVASEVHELLSSETLFESVFPLQPLCCPLS